jgi:hypothetical protein
LAGLAKNFTTVLKRRQQLADDIAADLYHSPASR